MGWYRTFGRTLFFALPPESAHRLAGAMLGLPLPWERIGGAVDDPRLEVTLAGIPLRNPIGLAAGFDKKAGHLDALGRVGFGYTVGGTVTARPRRGNPKPRIVRIPERRSIVNSMGLPNPGAHVAAARLRRTRRTGPRMISIADEGLADVLATHALLEPLVDGIELNVSCPNVSFGRDRDNEAHLGEVLTRLAETRQRPLFVKLPPFESDAEREAVLAVARIAHEGGVEGLTCTNTRPVEEPRLASGRGGLSGRDLFESTLRVVRDVRETTGGELPINACGGITSAEDALACVESGATTVQIYTGMIYEGPGIVGDITCDLAAELRERGAEFKSLVGAI